MTESSKRTKSIKIRLSEEEHEKLLKNKECAELATWMRSICLNHGSTDPVKPKTSPELLKELNRIGVNLNQIAKAMNKYELIDQIRITNHLRIISEQMDEVIKKL